MSAERTAFLGLGIMGWPQAANLRAAGHELTVWTRDRAKARRFASEHGATAAESPKEAAAEAGVMITMLPDTPEVETVIDRAEPPEGSLVVDMSTIRPTASRAIAEQLAERGVAFLDAPVTGSRPKAEDGTLTIMVGGDAADLERARPLLEAMGKLVVHAGPHGHGSMVKLINNTLAAVNAAALAEGITLARAAGVDLDAMEQVVGAGSGNSAMLELKARPMREGDFEPLFKLEHMLKDVRHCLSEAQELGLDLEVAGTAETRYALADAEGLGEEDFAAVIRAVGGS
ncbi:MAG TPA: NAD(P)-dependent oxidoreductase [Thermoleophilaceae bacterium]|nr:NAD(P)-dependent oxidoreductase [Thermoleophilaceae bacterium]